MLQNNTNQKKIRNVIKENSSNKLYHVDDLSSVSKQIIEKSFELVGNDITDEDIITFVAHYLHYSTKEKKYYFSVKKKQKVIDENVSLLQINNQTVLDINPQVSEICRALDEQENTNTGPDISPEIYNKVYDVCQEELEELVPPQELESNDIFIVHHQPTTTLAKDEQNNNEILDTDEMDKLEEEFFKQMKISNTKIYDNKENKIQKNYAHPKEQQYTITKKTLPEYGPFGTQWIRDIQVDDDINERECELALQFDKLRKVVLPEQRSDAWFAMRDGKITASDAGVAVGDHHHEKQYSFILKKVLRTPFPPNANCYHGKKFETPATMIYEYRMNVQVEEFGLMGHPIYDFLGASPDGICSRYKLDLKHKSKYVGRMLEIKCPVSRKILKEGPVKDGICPIYYWNQVQLQLECCDLEECDFWQCSIYEYPTREDFIFDTATDEPFRSATSNFEKGCLIQLLPKEKVNYNDNEEYWKIVWDHAIFIYPPKIEMSPYDCDMWVAETISNLNVNPKYYKYAFDRVIYWRLDNSFNITIKRDKEWFAANLPIYKQMWDYILFFRANADKTKLLTDFIDSLDIKRNKEIMNMVERLYNTGAADYKIFIADLTAKMAAFDPGSKKVRAKPKSNYNFRSPSAFKSFDKTRNEPTVSMFVD